MDPGFAFVMNRGITEPSTNCVERRTRDTVWVTSPCCEVYVAERSGKACEQPLVTSVLILCYSGHIDNRQEVAASLRHPELATASEGVIFAAVYERWREDCHHHLIGHYSFALFDRVNTQLVVGRDALGLGRVYYAETKQGVHVASTIELLLASLPDTPTYDHDGLAEFLHIGALGEMKTFFSGVRLVPPGGILTVTTQGMRCETSWKPDLDTELRYRQSSEYDDQLRSLLYEAVGSTLRDDARVVTELSGGLDSSTVTVIAADLARRGAVNIRALTAYSIAASQTPRSDESQYQRAVAKACNIEHYTIDADRFPCFGRFEGDWPSEPSMYLANPIVHTAIRDFGVVNEVDCCLTGEAGDSLFIGDKSLPWFLYEWARQGRLVDWTKALRSYVVGGHASLLSLMCVSSGIGWKPERVAAPDWMTPIFRERFEASVAADLERKIAGTACPARALQFALIQRHACHWRDKYYKWTERHPLMYRPLVEFMIRVPWELKLSATQDRVLQRRALEGLLPPLVRCRQDKGQPDAGFLKGLRENWDVVKELITGGHLAALNIVEPESFRRTCVQMRHGLLSKRTGFSSIWSALTFEYWMKYAGTARIADVRAQFRKRLERTRSVPAVVCAPR